MFSFTEWHGQTSQEKHGTIRLNTTCDACQKPLWLVLIKLVVLAGMVAVGGFVVGTVAGHFLPPWKAAAATAGILVLYVGVAFFFRPEANTDNMGWFGGMGNDPFQYSDNINRFLFKLHMLLGPGRFCAEALLDACVLVGLAGGSEVHPEQPAGEQEPATLAQAAPTAVAEPASAPRSDRFDAARGQVNLESWKYFPAGQRPQGS